MRLYGRVIDAQAWLGLKGREDANCHTFVDSMLGHLVSKPPWMEGRPTLHLLRTCVHHRVACSLLLCLCRRLSA